MEDLTSVPVRRVSEAPDGVDKVDKELGHLELSEVTAPPEVFLSTLGRLDNSGKEVV